MYLKTYLRMSQTLDLFLQTYISNIISFFLDVFLILRRFIYLMGICFEEKVYYMIVKVERQCRELYHKD